MTDITIRSSKEEILDASLELISDQDAQIVQLKGERATLAALSALLIVWSFL